MEFLLFHQSLPYQRFCVHEQNNIFKCFLYGLLHHTSSWSLITSLVQLIKAAKPANDYANNEDEMEEVESANSEDIMEEAESATDEDEKV